ncbi:putative ribonuclease H-like domain-containing protein [Tanacetum coccineum]
MMGLGANISSYNSREDKLSKEKELMARYTVDGSFFKFFKPDSKVSDIDKRTKIKPKTTKPSTEWKKREKVKVKRPKKRSTKSKSKIKDDADIEEMLYGPTHTQVNGSEDKKSKVEIDGLGEHSRMDGYDDFATLSSQNESVTSIPNVATREAKTCVSKPKSVSEPLIEDWISDSEDENETEFKSKQRKPSFAKTKFVKSNEHVKTPKSLLRRANNTVKGNITTTGPKAAVSDNKGNITTAGPKAVVSDNKGNITTVGPKAVVSDNKGNITSVGPKAVEKGVIDSGCSRHMTGNKSYLSDYEEINGGFVAFGGDPKGGKISGKGKISTDTECVILSPDFKLLDENYVLLRVPRKDNMYRVDLKNIIPSGDLTCLFAKAILDESNLWHRRLGHINFKTMNKLVRKNLVRGLPSKIFKNNHTCVACQKGKQHKASFVTDDYSRFSWVFFLATKDETSEILKTFKTGIENLIDLKVKVIRCDNGTEFKNKVMNQFCEMKGIMREFSVARTPQQNRVAERKNRTLIQAARTMLPGSKLPTTLWAEAVNTTCYV